MSVMRNTALLASASLLWVLPSPAAFAQGSSPQAASESSGLEEIVVTARRREEKVQSVPVAITAFSQDSLQKKSITAVQNLQYAVPSLQVSGQNRDDAVFVLHGIGAGPIATGERAVQS